MKWLRIAPVVLLAVSIAGPVAAQSASDGARRLRTLFFLRDYETACLEGEKLVAASPDASELAAWLVLNLARDGQDAKAVALAEDITTNQAGQLELVRAGWRPGLAARASRRSGRRGRELALKLLPGSPDVAGSAPRPSQATRNGVTRSIDVRRPRQRARRQEPGRAPRLEGLRVLYLASHARHVRRGGDSPRRSPPLKRPARATRPSLNAWYLPGAYLNRSRRSRRRLPAPEEGRRRWLPVRPPSTRRSGERSTGSRGDLGADRKRQEIEADVVAVPAGAWEIALARCCCRLQDLARDEMDRAPGGGTRNRRDPRRSSTTPASVRVGSPPTGGVSSGSTAHEPRSHPRYAAVPPDPLPSSSRAASTTTRACSARRTSNLLHASSRPTRASSWRRTATARPRAP